MEAVVSLLDPPWLDCCALSFSKNSVIYLTNHMLFTKKVLTEQKPETDNVMDGCECWVRHDSIQN